MENKKKYPTIVLFDGFCCLCSRAVDFIMKRDKKQLIRFVALQTEAGEYLINRYGLDKNYDTVVLWQEGRFYFFSEAALKIASHLRFPWTMVTFFRMVPVSLRDRIYRRIAQNRYKWFGRRDFCRIPSKTEARYFPSLTDLQLEISLLETAKKE